MPNRRYMFVIGFMLAGIVTAIGTGEGSDGSGPDDPNIDIAIATPDAEYRQIAAFDINGDGFDDLAATSTTTSADGTAANRLEVFVRDASAASTFGRIATRPSARTVSVAGNPP